MTKRVLGSIKRLLEYDIEYYGTPSGNYGLVPTCPQHTCRGGGQKIFSQLFVVFMQKSRFFWTMFWVKDHYRSKNSSKIGKFFFPEFMNIFQKKRKNCKILKFFV